MLIKRINLNIEVMQIAADRAYERFLRNRHAGARDLLTTDKDTMRDKIDGIVGELAYAKMANMNPDLTTDPRKGGADFTFKYKGQGKTIDVKSTRHKLGKLIVHAQPGLIPCDFYALMIVDDFGAWYAGVAAGPTLVRPENLDSGLNAYALEQSSLKETINELLRGMEATQ